MKSIQGDLNSLVTTSIGRLLWSYSLPAMVGMVMISLYNVIDRVFIGQVVGPNAIAGLAVTFPVMNLSAALGVLVGVGASARTSIMLGAKRIDQAEQVLGNALSMMLIITICYLSLFAIFLDDILLAFGASEATLPYARDFMRWILPGMFVMNFTFSFNNVMRASGYPVKAMWTMIMGAGINMVLAPTFIYILDLGIKGAAMATDISMTISGIFVLQHFCSAKHTVHFRRGIYRMRWRTVWGIVNIGAAPSVVNAASCLINVIINKSLYKYGGDTAIAAAGIFVTYTPLLTTLCIGLCQGMQPILGYNYGAGRYDRLKGTYWLAVKWATGVCALGFLGAMLIPDLIARAFTGSADLIAATTVALRTALLAFALVGFQTLSTALFQSIGQAGKSIFLSLTRQVLFLIPLLLTLPRLWGLRGVWSSFWISDTLATLVTLGMVLLQLRHFDKRATEVEPANTPI